MSKISVVVPIYNAGKKLHKCIRSLLNQSFKDFELILVNDGSTDKSLNICRMYQQEDSRIVVIDKHNEGSILTRRRGIEAATSKYAMFVDADDWVHCNILEILYKQMIDHDLDIVVCNIFRVLGRTLLIKDKYNSNYFQNDKFYDTDQIKKELATAYLWGHEFPPSLSAKLYKKDLLLSSGKYLEQITFLCDDMYYNLEMFLKANRVKVITTPLYYYRFGGFTSKYMSYFFDDVINGYQIQKQVIEEYYQDTRNTEYDGPSIMLLNLVKSALYNLFNGKFDENKTREIIRSYISNENILECLDNKGCLEYFSAEYLNAIRNQNVDYFYQMGRKMYIKKIPKRFLMKVVSNVL